jgi:DNA-binding LacI/PurR family transcriptional regulator
MNEKKKNISLKDIAQRAGVSIATVSRALQGSEAINHETRERIQILAEELNYRPNYLAQSLRNDVIPVIGVIVPHGVTIFYSAVIDGIEKVALSQGYAVVTMNSHESYEEECYNVENLVNLHVAGIIVAQSQETIQYNHFLSLKDHGIEVVFVAREPSVKLFSSVVADNVNATYKATLHLLDNGCKNIALLGGPNSLNMIKERKHGYITALHERKIKVRPELVACDKFDKDKAMKNFLKMLSLEQSPDGILALNDTLLFAALRTIRKCNLQIPNDIAVIGFSDVEYVQDITPSVSTVADQSQLMGENACNQLLKQIAGDHSIHRIVVPTIIKIRESSIRTCRL